MFGEVCSVKFILVWFGKVIEDVYLVVGGSESYLKDGKQGRKCYNTIFQNLLKVSGEREYCIQPEPRYRDPGELNPAPTQESRIREKNQTVQDSGDRTKPDLKTRFQSLITKPEDWTRMFGREKI